jgi:1,6-anhydro-N-acetylmuramate kinase
MRGGGAFEYHHPYPEELSPNLAQARVLMLDEAGLPAGTKEAMTFAWQAKEAVVGRSPYQHVWKQGHGMSWAKVSPGKERHKLWW